MLTIVEVHAQFGSGGQVASNAEHAVGLFADAGAPNVRNVQLLGIAGGHRVAADQVNEYIAQTAPWALAKDPARREELHIVLSTSLQAFADIAGVLKPIVPATVAQAEAWLGVELAVDRRIDLDGRSLAGSYPQLFTRIDPKLIDAMTDASKDTLAAAAPPTPAKPAEAKNAEAKKPEAAAAAAPAPAGDTPAYIGIEDFARLDLRIGTVLECGFVEGSDKLLRFLLDAGDLGQRQIFSGIRASYGEPEKLVGRSVVFIANLAPRKMRFGISEGMILSAGFDGGALALLDADTGAQPGMPVR